MENYVVREGVKILDIFLSQLFAHCRNFIKIRKYRAETENIVLTLNSNVFNAHYRNIVKLVKEPKVGTQSFGKCH